MIKRMVGVMLGLTLALAAVGCGGKSATTEKTGEDAVDAAINWLLLIDGEKYAESWSQSAEYFKTSIPQEQWVSLMNSGKKPLGKVVTRELKEKRDFTTIPGAPDGRYVVIKFSTSFANKNTATETVTPKLEPDGKWRVSGYYVE